MPQPPKPSDGDDFPISEENILRADDPRPQRVPQYPSKTTGARRPLKKAEDLKDTAVLSILNPVLSGPVVVTPTATVPATSNVYDVTNKVEVPLDEFLMIQQENAVVVFADNKVLGFQRGDLTAAGDNYSLASMLVPAADMVPVLNSTHPYWKLEKSQNKGVYTIVPVTMASGGTRGKTYRKRKTSRKSKASGTT